MAESQDSLRTYVLVFVALLALTGATIGVAYLQIEPWHLAAAILLATVKATLVTLFFMHLVHSSRLVALVFCASFLWLILLLALTFSDYLTRSWL